MGCTGQLYDLAQGTPCLGASVRWDMLAVILTFRAVVDNEAAQGRL